MNGLLNDRYLINTLRMQHIPKAELWIDVLEFQSQSNMRDIKLNSLRDFQIFEMDINHYYKQCYHSVVAKVSKSNKRYNYKVDFEIEYVFKNQPSLFHKWTN